MQDMDPGPAKILHKPEKGDTQKMLQPRMKRPVADSAAKHRKISEEHQNYLPSNTHLEGKLSSKYYLRFARQFQWEMAGFSMVCSESELRLVDIVYISWLNKISSKGQIGPTCMGPLASEITFAKKKIISRSKITLVLARIEF